MTIKKQIIDFFLLDFLGAYCGGGGADTYCGGGADTYCGGGGIGTYCGCGGGYGYGT